MYYLELIAYFYILLKQIGYQNMNMIITRLIAEVFISKPNTLSFKTSC